MKNYVLIYNLSDGNSQKEFERQLKVKFPRHQTTIENNFNYFSFAEKKLPAVQDMIQSIMDVLHLGETDYIALFYTKEEEPDMIHRLMIFGTSNLIDNDLKKISQTIHERVLGELLEATISKN